MTIAFDNQPAAEGIVGTSPDASASFRRWQTFHWFRFAIATLATVTLLPYAWGFTLIVYSRWGQIDRRYLIQLIGGIVGVMVMTFQVATSFRSQRTANRALVGVLTLWTAVMAALIIFRNGEALATWAVFAFFYPATLWVLWTAWMFSVRMRWYVRFGVLALLIAAVVPFLLCVEVKGLTGASNVNFALRNWKPVLSVEIPSSAGELKAASVKLVADAHTDFPGFQGPDRTAVLSNVRLDRDWKAHPPRQLWRVQVGDGWSGFAVVGDYAVTQEQRGDFECVVCRDRATGREIWLHKDSAPYGEKPRYEGMGGPGPRATPTIDRGRVYTVGATGILNCLQGGTGQTLWSRNIVTENGGSVAGHGVCGSPLIVGDAVVVSPTGKDDASLAAYDCQTGKPRWKAGHDSAAYATPLLAAIGPSNSQLSEQILNYTSHGITGHDPASGKVLWHYDWSNDQSVVCSEPIAAAGGPDQVLLTTGYGKGSTLLKVTRAANGAWSAAPLWANRNMKTKFTTAVLRDGYVYGLDDGIFQCIDVATGEQKWKRGRYEHGQILLVDDLILVQTEGGPVVLLEPNPQKLIELGKIPALSSKTWSGPALAGKYLLVRNDQEAACYELALRER